MQKIIVFSVVVLFFIETIHGGSESYPSCPNYPSNSSSNCVPYEGVTGQGYLKVCDDSILDNFNRFCDSFISIHQNCVELNKKEYHRGFSENPRYQCIIYSEPGCEGNEYIVAHCKVEFPWRAMSMRCPYKC